MLNGDFRTLKTHLCIAILRVHPLTMHRSEVVAPSSSEFSDLVAANDSNECPKPEPSSRVASGCRVRPRSGRRPFRLMDAARNRDT